MKQSPLVVCFFIFCLYSDSQAQQSQSIPPNQQVSNKSNYADSINNGLIAEDTLKGSVHRVSAKTIGGCHMNIEYNSPGVRGREIWGSLVPYNQVWVTGAHMATAVTITTSIRLDGTVIPPGKYALFTIPGSGSWTIILNRNPNQHQADDYKQSEDLVRVTVQPAAHAITKRLTYEIIKKKKKKGEILMNWELLSIAVPFEVE